MKHLYRKNYGFTLIELLVTMTIIGVLASVAIPQYTSYKQRAFDSLALSDLRNVALAEEAYFTDEDRYLSCEDATCLELPGLVALSRGVRVTISISDENFNGTAHHERGTSRVYHWSSAEGGLIP